MRIGAVCASTASAVDEDGGRKRARAIGNVCVEPQSSAIDFAIWDILEIGRARAD
jgi:hypothetical protein